MPFHRGNENKNGATNYTFRTNGNDIHTNEEFDETFSFIPETGTKPFIEIFVEFSLSGNQYINEDTLKACKAIAKIKVKEIALAEDSIIYTGKLPVNSQVKFSNGS